MRQKTGEECRILAPFYSLSTSLLYFLRHISDGLPPSVEFFLFMAKCFKEYESTLA